jgi:hypothetical protein
MTNYYTTEQSTALGYLLNDYVSAYVSRRRRKRLTHAVVWALPWVVRHIIAIAICAVEALRAWVRGR